MILFVIQLVLSTLFTGLYLGSQLSLTWIHGIWALLLFIGLNIAFLLLVILTFVINALLFHAKRPEALWKHQYLGQCCEFAFEHWLRTKLIIHFPENLPVNHQFVIVSNHVGFTDPMYIIEAFRNYPLGFIAKSTLFRVPVVRQVLLFIGCIPIERTSDRQAVKAIIEGAKSVQSGKPMMIFPEGTRSHKKEMQDFKPGSFKLATKANATIVPVCIYGVHLAKPAFRLKRAKVHLAILPSIQPNEYEGMDTTQIAKMVQEKIQNQITSFDSNPKTKL